ncbi:MAG: hypothetical protein WC379_10755 [Methanoregula sp.]
MTSTNDYGALSIDFLIGFTIFILAFVWIATMIPGMLIGLSSNTIDYDAVAYRTGVILVEDPGWRESPGWETFPASAKDMDIIRFGLAARKDSPNILSESKITRFFNVSTPANPGGEFIYPDDYRPRVIFGDYPYKFNITLRDVEREKIYSVGEILPEDYGTSNSRMIEYGYIRRLVKIKSPGNTTINMTEPKNYPYNTTDEEPNFQTTHEFAVLINVSRLMRGAQDPAFQADTSRAHDPAYLIDPTRDQTIINITHINSTLNDTVEHSSGTQIHLMNISLKALESGKIVKKIALQKVIVDGKLKEDNTDPWGLNHGGFLVTDNVSVILEPEQMKFASQGGTNLVTVNYTFELNVGSPFLNSTNATAFDYNYDWGNVTQPSLRDGILEVAVW